MRDYFCGWYFKCQSETQTLALIPAIHQTRKTCFCSIQILTEEGSRSICTPYDQFRTIRGNTRILIGENYFGKEGIRLQIRTPELSATGVLRFGPFSSIRYDIMGPFRYVPLMQCRHSVFSMKHSVNGTLCIDGKDYRFSKAVGYMEGDRGSSFPKEYAWTQCCFEGGSLMLSTADIPLGSFHFTGIIGVILWHGKEYRLATYLGAKALKIRKGEIIIRQGESLLSVRLSLEHAKPLYAPKNGSMSRTIHESASGRAAYCFRHNNRTLFSFETTSASFEYEYPV